MGVVVAKKQSDFLGKRSLSLLFNQSEKREQLVGLKPVDGHIQIGGRILAEGHIQVPCPSIGNVTSAAESPTVGNIGLAVIEAGFSKMGDTVHIYANSEVSTAEICSPVFYDPENQRLNA
jgi:sarcosine oxidase subunit alpha